MLANQKLRPPIFLIGNYRSGTTITQNLIGLHPDIATWYEPRPLWLYADPSRKHDEFSADDANAKVVRYIRDRFLKFQMDHGGKRVMENTPSNVLRVPYVDAIFPDATYLYITRNPFSCISSIELKWQRTKTLAGIRRSLAVVPFTQLHHYAGTFLKQMIDKKILKKKYTSFYGPRYKGFEQDQKERDMMKIIARQWARGNRKAREDLGQLDAGRVLSFRYEDLVEAPDTVLKRIYDHCGLEYTGEIGRAATEMVDPGRQMKWQRLDAASLKAILPELEEEMAFYGYEVPAALQ